MSSTFSATRRRFQINRDINRDSDRNIDRDIDICFCQICGEQLSSHGENRWNHILSEHVSKKFSPKNELQPLGNINSIPYLMSKPIESLSYNYNKYRQMCFESVNKTTSHRGHEIRLFNKYLRLNEEDKI